MRRVLPHGAAQSLPAQTVITFVLVAGLLRLARPDRAVAWWLAESLIVTAVAVGVHLSRRRTDSRAIDVTERELPVLDRQLRQYEIPEETDRRYAMRRLVTYRTRQLERTDWLVPVFLCFMGFAPLIYLLDGAWLMGAGALVFVVLFGWWLVSMRRRNRKLLRRMDDELDQMSRKRPGGPVTCRVGWQQGADLHRWSFGCFTVMPVNADGSPRKAPGKSHRRRPLSALCRRRGWGAG